MNAVTPLSAARAPQLDPRNVAVGWMFRAGMTLQRVDALEGCITYLMAEHDMSEQAAEIAAIQAYAEVATVNQPARIDVDATTSHVVVLRTAGNRAVMLTIDDLVATLEQARREGRAQVVNSDTRTPVVIQR
ncbi:hypothetical protein SAMN05661010_00046 [Modicisalibacter muralis]|uniref:Uncharacterized protein n=1 Tax=Modicisalibacter muralis TaxID=119000 RepID=A0A1G9ENP8_9GAMM|nr:hypothetical protein [Halomonas muralis]SDK77718.1 hypothetical protein SAMN05661010_00046 [Halomonas muralis]